MLQWYDGSSWEHRAFWGENYIGQQISTVGVQGTEGQRYMGGLQFGKWWRIEIPASYVGLEGKAVSGMAFTLYGKEPTVTWDRSGKAATLTSGTVPSPLSATSGVWKLFSNTYGYSYNTNDQGEADHFPKKGNCNVDSACRYVFFVRPNQAAGTVPFYRFKKSAEDKSE